MRAVVMLLAEAYLHCISAQGPFQYPFLRGLRVGVSAFTCTQSCAYMLLQVKIQTSPGYAKGLTDGLPKFVQENGVAG